MLGSAGITRVAFSQSFRNLIAVLDRFVKGHGRIELLRFNHESPLVSINRRVEVLKAQLPIVNTPLDVRAGFLIADGAGRRGYTTSDRHILYHVGIQVFDQLLRHLRTEDVSICDQFAIDIAGSRSPLDIRDHDGIVDTSTLLILDNPRLADVHFGKAMKRFSSKTLKVLIHIVAAHPHTEYKHLIGGQRA